MWNFPLAPENASTYAEKYDVLFGVITALTIFFTVVVLALVIFFAVKYRVGSKANRDRPSHENLKVEIAWSAPPLILGVAIFGWGAMDFVFYKSPPKDAIEMFVIGKQWMWHIQHPNGVRENNTLHVPVGKPVKLTMISQDVLHAMYIPQFRVQYHVVPGRYTSLWFEATKPGRYYMFCAQHCGTQHSEMGGYVYAMSQKDYAEWLQNGGESTKPNQGSIAQQGKKLFDQLACGTCHGPDDTEKGPSLYALSGSKRTMRDGGSTTADDDYIRESIIEPYRMITKGYTNTMPPDYKNQLTEEHIRTLIEYIKTLGVMPVSTGANNNSSAGHLGQTPSTPARTDNGGTEGRQSLPVGRS